MPQQLTKEHFDGVIHGLRETVATKEDIRDIIRHFNTGQGVQNKRLGTMEEKLDSIGEDVTKIKLAVVDLMGTDRHMHNLVRELKIKGIPLEESKIFTSSIAP